MRQYQSVLLVLAGFLIAVFVALPGQRAAGVSPGTHFISQSAILTGLAPGAVFPFIDTTPNRIVQAHVAVTNGGQSDLTGVNTITASAEVR
jgi:hypothetical protein